MSYCEVVQMSDGSTAILRKSGRPPALCEFCRVRRHTRLCDKLIPYDGRPAGPRCKPLVTCDAKICEQCSVRIDAKTDFCPRHANQPATAGSCPKCDGTGEICCSSTHYEPCPVCSDNRKKEQQP